jgi:hypothetical protein
MSIELLSLAMKESFGEGAIRTSRGEAHCKSSFLTHQLLVFFCTDKIHGGQDRVFLFQGGLINYKAHYDLSWYRPLLRGNSPSSSSLILKMTNGYNGVS